MNMKKKAILALMLSVAMCFSACDFEDLEETDIASTTTQSETVDRNASTSDTEDATTATSESQDTKKDGKGDGSTSGFTLSVDGSNGELSVTRAGKKSKSMGNDGTWTIFVYLCC